jgi:GNAT superfamily N-acetyltransferase
VADMPIRVAAASDLPQLQQLSPTHSEAVTKATHAGRCHVAEENEAILGFVILEYSFYAYGFVSLLHVHEDHRRRGIAMALMARAEEECTTPKLFTSTNGSNKPMQHLCDRLGFVPSGVILNLDEGDPELVYVKRVPKEPDA